MAKPSVAKQCLALSGLYEIELLSELMLRYWNHPFASDADFRDQLLEAAVEVLKASIAGKRLIEYMPPSQMNFVSALWYAEWVNVTADEVEQSKKRRK
jgi:hypothetical protein